MPRFGTITGFVLGALFIGGLVFDYTRAPRIISEDGLGRTKSEKTIEERIAEAKLKSENRKGVYMTYDVAADKGVAARRLRNAIMKLMDETELNAVVIDVKETGGTMISDELKKTLDEFHQRGAWVIARMTMMRDNSQVTSHPEYYIKRTDGGFWRDNHGHAWMDPASKDVWAYQAGEVKKAIDLGFDEIQFDYVRFPSDGNMKNIAYPVYDPKTPKYETIKGFLEFMNQELRRYKPDIILSADLFGYVAVQTEDLNIGQRLVDIADSVDYISLMVYPSHYYAGFYIKPDAERNLPALFIPYKDADTAKVASARPYPIVHRSMLFAEDVLTKKIIATSTQADGTIATTTTVIKPKVKMRPWLQDFDLGVDKARGIYYDAAKVREQIRAAEDAGTSGWLLWNASNVYTTEALKKRSP